MNWTELKSRSYCPYSKKQSATIIQSASGTFYAGVRVENISFPLSITAIQAALFSCISEGDKPSILIVPKGDKPELLEYWASEFNLEIQVQDDIDGINLVDSKKTVEGPLVEQLKALLPRAAVQHSDFPVSCLIELDEGYIEGVNIEVENWQLGLCAERVAIAKAYASGYTNFKSIYVHTEHADFSSPCGACRQVIYEHMPYHDIHLYHNDGSRSKLVTVDLLPYHFKSSFLSS